jgi:hypothetical protein
MIMSNIFTSFLLVYRDDAGTGLMKTGLQGMDPAFVYARDISTLNAPPRRPYMTGIPVQGIPFLAKCHRHPNRLRPIRTWATPRAYWCRCHFDIHLYVPSPIMYVAH